MRLLYSNVPPLSHGTQTLNDYIQDEIKKSDELIIAVGYVSKDSLTELDRILSKNKDVKITLILGMYYIEGFPETVYSKATALDKKWKDSGCGEIRVIRSMKFHGKIYGFFKDSKPLSAIIGSHNLGAIFTTADNRRQYELSTILETPEECIEVTPFLRKISIEPVSFDISTTEGIRIVHESGNSFARNSKLNGIEDVESVSSSEVFSYMEAENGIVFDIPLKVPGIPGDSKDYMKSNVNKAYAKGRETKKTGVIQERNWWETEVIVSKKITFQPHYPEIDQPFYVITDDGWKFTMHVAGGNKKNLESDSDLKIFGYWLKGRLVADKVVTPVDSTSEDLKRINPDATEDIYENCKGVITYQKLVEYGRTSLRLAKTSKQLEYKGKMVDVWTLSFLPRKQLD